MILEPRGAREDQEILEPLEQLEHWDLRDLMGLVVPRVHVVPLASPDKWETQETEELMDHLEDQELVDRLDQMDPLAVQDFRVSKAIKDLVDPLEAKETGDPKVPTASEEDLEGPEDPVPLVEPGTKVT